MRNNIIVKRSCIYNHIHFSVLTSLGVCPSMEVDKLYENQMIHCFMREIDKVIACLLKLKSLEIQLRKTGIGINVHIHK